MFVGWLQSLIIDIVPLSGEGCGDGYIGLSLVSSQRNGKVHVSGKGGTDLVGLSFPHRDEGIHTRM